jgi:hypothetical protein
MHGAGFAVREQRGQRVSVRSNFRTGNRAKPETIAALMQERPELRSLFRKYSDSTDLMDLQPMVAEARALFDYATENLNLETPQDILDRMAVIGRLVKIVARVVDAERKKAPIKPADLDRLLDSFVSTIVRFVRPEDHQAVLDYWRTLLATGRDAPTKTGSAGPRSAT